MTIFLYGPNSYAMRQQVSQMVQAYTKKAGSDFGLERIDGAGIRPSDLKVSLQATPFMATSRLVIVEGVAANKSGGDKLTDVLASVPATTVAVFVEREVDQRTTAFKSLKQADKVIKFDLLEGPKLHSWIKREIEGLGGTAEGPAIRELAELAGNDQWRLSGEVVKLVNYSKAVSVQHIKELVVPSVERPIFDLVEAMAAGRTAPSLNSYHDLLRQKESEIYILTMIQWQLRNLLMAKSAPAQMAPSELAKEAGMSPYVAGKMAVAQRTFDQDKLALAYKLAADCEYDIKTGRLKAEAAVERLIYRVSTSAKA